MAPSGRKMRMLEDAAQEHMRDLGFQECGISESIKELLEVYGEDQWFSIEDESYAPLLSIFLEKQEKKYKHLAEVQANQLPENQNEEIAEEQNKKIVEEEQPNQLPVKQEEEEEKGHEQDMHVEYGRDQADELSTTSKAVMEPSPASYMGEASTDYASNPVEGIENLCCGWLSSEEEETDPEEEETDPTEDSDGHRTLPGKMDSVDTSCDLNNSEFDKADSTSPNHGSKPSAPESQGSALRPPISIDDILNQPGRERLKQLDPDFTKGATWFGDTDSRISKSILWMLHNLLKTAYPTFSEMPLDEKDLWFRKFAQDYNWKPVLTSKVRQHFEKECGNQYRQHMHQWKMAWKKDKSKHKGLTQPVWEQLKIYWALPATATYAELNSKKAKRGRPRKGQAVHNSGGMSFLTRKKRLIEKAGGDFCTLMEETLTDKKTGKIQDPIIADIVNNVKKRKEDKTVELNQQRDGLEPPVNLSRDEINQMVLEETFVRRGQYFGLGNVTQSVASPGTDGATRLEILKTKAELAETKGNLKDVMDKLETFAEENKRITEENMKIVEENKRIAEEYRKIEEENKTIAEEKRRIVEEYKKMQEFLKRQFPNL